MQERYLNYSGLMQVRWVVLSLLNCPYQGMRGSRLYNCLAFWHVLPTHAIAIVYTKVSSPNCRYSGAFQNGRVMIKGTSSLGSSFVSNYGSVIDAFSTDIYLTGKITFQDNKATYGAAILLESNSHIIIAENSTILFQNYNAFLDGGAIYPQNTYCKNRLF